MFLLLSITGAAFACGYDCHQTVQIGQLNCVFFFLFRVDNTILFWYDWFSIRDLRFFKVTKSCAPLYRGSLLAWHMSPAHRPKNKHMPALPRQCSAAKDCFYYSNVLDFLSWNCGSTEGIRRNHNRTCQPVDLTSNSFYIACLGGKRKNNFHH